MANSGVGLQGFSAVFGGFLALRTVLSIFIDNLKEIS